MDKEKLRLEYERLWWTEQSLDTMLRATGNKIHYEPRLEAVRKELREFYNANPGFVPYQPKYE